MFEKDSQSKSGIYSEDHNSAQSSALRQKGIFPTFGYYQDIQDTLQFANFISSANDIASFSERSDITNEQNSLLERRARELASYGNFSLKVAVKFLRILINIDQYSILKKVADVLDISELDNPSIVQDADEILNIPSLNRAAFLASAVYAIIEKYSRFIESANKTNNTFDSLLSSISELSSVFSSIQGLQATETPEQKEENGNPPIPKTMGIGPGKPKPEENGPPAYPKYDNPIKKGSSATRHKVESGLSEIVNFSSLFKLYTGKEIPATMRANNPMAKAPSHIGKVFFGEKAHPIADNDLEKLFTKLLGVFSLPSGGVGSQSFDFQNSSEFSNISVENMINKFTGTSSTGKFANLFTQNLDKFKNLTGAKGDEDLDLRDADVAIPTMIAMSSVIAGNLFDKSPYGEETFVKGFQKSLAVSNEMQKRNSEFISTIRRL